MHGHDGCIQGLIDGWRVHNIRKSNVEPHGLKLLDFLCVHFCSNLNSNHDTHGELGERLGGYRSPPS